MDDPWAAPPWSTPAKSSSSSPPQGLTMSMTPPRESSTFDVSDPWGAPTPATARHSTGPPAQPDSPTVSRTTVSETPGWGHESSWGDGDIPPPRSSLEQDSPSLGVTRLNIGQEDVMPSSGGTDPISSPSPPPRISFEITPDPDPFQPTSNSLTPPKSFSALPEFASPQTPLSFHSPHSHRSMTPAAPQTMDEEDPEAAFVAALPRSSSANDLPKFDMPKSPSFGDGDFGGFSSGLGDPWGSGEKVETGWGGEQDNRGSPEVAGEVMGNEGTVDGNDETGEGWGYVRPVQVETVQRPIGGEEDWEVAQRRIQLQESLIPHEKLDGLKNGWKQVGEAVIGLNKLPSPTDTDTQALDDAIRKLELDRDETLRSLAAVPSDINTYPPILSSFTTHTTYLTSLSRPHPAPSASFLVNNTKRLRHSETTDESSKSSSWLSRSRLGEPEITAGDTAPQEQEAKSRWAFWGRRPTVERQLTTSGGGVLEVKTATTSTASMELRKSTSHQSLSVNPPSATGKSSASTSRPVSIFEAPADIMTVQPSPTIASPLSTTTGVPPPADPVVAGTASPVSTAMAPAPSAVSRFFGRWRTTSAGAPPDQTLDDNAKDLELGEDDFSYLGQVPSLAPPQPNLFDDHSPRNESMASLESMISSRPTPLPAPLAPPPAFAAPIYPRSDDFAGIPKSKGRAKGNDMDLLSGLYDDDDPGRDASEILQSNKGEIKKDPIGWDDFLGPSPSVPPKPTSIPTAVPPPSAHFRPNPQQNNSSISSTSDFDDFGTPQAVNQDFIPSPSTTFDDFGDFSTFETSPIQPPPPPRNISPPSTQRIPFLFTPSQPAAPPPISYKSPLPTIDPSSSSTPFGDSHRPRPSLDHTPTINLVNEASTTKGQRWPAPLSPDMPGLAPPPSAPGASRSGGSFPFLSPPPPPRPGSRSGRLMSDLMNGGDGDVGTMDAAVSDRNMGNGEIGQGIHQGLMSPVSVKPAGLGSFGMISTPPKSSVQQNQGKGGLSAQDLSFFDNL